MGKYTLRRVSLKGCTPDHYYTLTARGFSRFYKDGRRRRRRVWKFRKLRGAYDAMLFFVAEDNSMFFEERSMDDFFAYMQRMRIDIEKLAHEYQKSHQIKI